jgi:hypothetical protein
MSSYLIDGSVAVPDRLLSVLAGICRSDSDLVLQRTACP